MDDKTAATVFSALGQETRIRLLRLLAGAGGAGSPAGELGLRLGVPQSTLSFHLAALEKARLVRSTRRGRQIVYALQQGGVRALLSFVTDSCCGGQPWLCDEPDALLPGEGETAPAMAASYNVLFLCTHNSARSIMAESILDRLGKGRFNPYSAGSEPAAAPLPAVVDKLRSLGHDVSRLRSKSLQEFTVAVAPRMDFIIALCDTPEAQDCAAIARHALTGFWPLPDPAHFSGSETERDILLNQLYSALRRRLDTLCSLPLETLDRMAVKRRLDEIGQSTPIAA